MLSNKRRWKYGRFLTLINVSSKYSRTNEIFMLFQIRRKTKRKDQSPSRQAVPNLFGTRDQFRGRIFPWTVQGMREGWFGDDSRGREESDMTEQLHFHFSLSCIGEGNGNPLQCSCLENARGGGAWWAAVYGVAQSWTWLKRLSSSSSSSSKCVTFIVHLLLIIITSAPPQIIRH